ncbi:MAG: hypothetical protein RL698_2780 [Pseudomonadota bacterium]
MAGGEPGDPPRGRGLRARVARRAAAREESRAARARESAAHQAPGGTAEHPIDIDSPAAIEARALSKACPTCLGARLLTSHDAETIDGQRLRLVRLHCPRCGVESTIFFRLANPAIH